MSNNIDNENAIIMASSANSEQQELTDDEICSFYVPEEETFTVTFEDDEPVIDFANPDGLFNSSPIPDVTVSDLPDWMLQGEELILDEPPQDGEIIMDFANPDGMINSSPMLDIPDDTVSDLPDWMLQGEEIILDEPPPQEGTDQNDNLKGSNVADIINAMAGDDNIKGRGGDDYILAGDGDDKVKGGRGNDTIFGGKGEDNIKGGRGSDKIHAGEDDDIVYGGRGNDTIHGNLGNDYVRGGSGDDHVYGGDGDDSVYGGRGNDIIHGQAGDDLVVGNLGNDSLYGGAGNDTIKGGRGHDIIEGGAGNDIMYGGKGNDTFRFDGGEQSSSTYDIILDFSSGDKIEIFDNYLQAPMMVCGNDIFDYVVGSVDSNQGFGGECGTIDYGGILIGLLYANIEQSGNDSVITFGDSQIVVKNYDAEDLQIEYGSDGISII